MYDLAMNRTISLSGHLSNIDEILLKWPKVTIPILICRCLAGSPSELNIFCWHVIHCGTMTLWEGSPEPAR